MERRRLNGWKAIAAHLDLSVRHCQRLDGPARLPVRRRPASQAVFAYVDEIEGWLESGGCVQHAAAGRSDITSRSTPEIIDCAEEGPAAVAEGDSGAALAVARSGLGESGSWRPMALLRRVPVRLRRVAVAIVCLSVMTPVGLYFAQTPGAAGESIGTTGLWTSEEGAWHGQADGAGRLRTGHWVAGGSRVELDIDPDWPRFSGGIEIHQDELHWTYISPSPRERVVHVTLMPAGRTEPIPFDSPMRGPFDLAVAIEERLLSIAVDGVEPVTVPLEPWDVGAGELMLRVGKDADEWLPAVAGRCWFGPITVRHPVAGGAPWMVQARSQAPQHARSYSLWVGNADDQIDILLDGRRVVSVRYLEEYGPFPLDPYLEPGQHTLTMRLFNRKWSANYGVELYQDGVPVWEKSCGDVRVKGGECGALGDRLGLSLELEHRFEVD